MIFDILASGSDANCSLVRHGKTAILVDCGLDYRRTLMALAEIGVAPEDITAGVVTHGHSDHARGIPLLAARLGIPVYATEGCLSSIRWGNYGPVKCIAIGPDSPFMVGEFTCQAWLVPHDASGAVAFSLGCDDGIVTVATDLGSIPDELAGAMRASNIVMIEANWDEDLMDESTYPSHLKRRISSGMGHLSTQAVCRLLPRLIPDITKKVFVGHISRANARPELTRLMCREALHQDIELEVIGDGPA